MTRTTIMLSCKRIQVQKRAGGLMSRVTPPPPPLLKWLVYAGFVFAAFTNYLCIE